MIYDLEAFRVGIALHQKSIAKIEEKSNAWTYIVIIVVICGIIAGIAYTCIKRRKH
jgi:hypothetical protein